MTNNYANHAQFAGTAEYHGMQQVRGFRSFVVRDDGILLGVVHHTAWPVGGLTAIHDGVVRECADLDDHKHGADCVWSVPPCEAPDPECACGLYAYFSSSSDYRSQGDVDAVVEASGRVLLGTRGFRAERARVVAICAADKPEPVETRRLLSGVVNGVVTYTTVQRLPKGASRGVSDETRDEVRKAYPGVPIFLDLDAMLREFPITDPDEWR